jgi:hypothetical protein
MTDKSKDQRRSVFLRDGAVLPATPMKSVMPATQPPKQTSAPSAKANPVPKADPPKKG